MVEIIDVAEFLVNNILAKVRTNLQIMSFEYTIFYKKTYIFLDMVDTLFFNDYMDLMIT